MSSLGFEEQQLDVHCSNNEFKWTIEDCQGTTWGLRSSGSVLIVAARNLSGQSKTVKGQMHPAWIEEQWLGANGSSNEFKMTVKGQVCPVWGSSGSVLMVAVIHLSGQSKTVKGKDSMHTWNVGIWDRRSLQAKLVQKAIVHQT
ncbi:hypothetical protein BU17DRAFT_60807 [Hysterangium stoloniferum]|nr:hypothetical protein BU17DRAFT_60807 [Hysterangium stoloniferum]